MIKIRDSQPVESAGSVESGEEVAQPKDLEIMTQVLGPRSRYHKGYGSMPRLKSVGGNRAASSRGTSQDREKDEIIAALKEQVATQAEQLATHQAMFESHQSMFAQMQQFIPGSQYQAPTFPPGATSSQNPSQTPLSD